MYVISDFIILINIQRAAKIHVHDYLEIYWMPKETVHYINTCGLYFLKYFVLVHRIWQTLLVYDMLPYPNEVQYKNIHVKHEN